MVRLATNKSLYLCLILLGIWVSYAPAQVGREFVPAIEIETPIYDFGTVPEGKTVRHDFPVFNKGDGPLEIKSVKPG